MATEAQARAFISQIAPLIQNESKARGYQISSTIIAQACCESAFGESSLGYRYHNYFGMKCGSAWQGASVNMKTKEEYTIGTLTNISANFRAYGSMEEGVKGYFDFISAKRYWNLKSAVSYRQYAEMLKGDGYATSSTYIATLCKLVEKYNLTEWDDRGDKKSDLFIAQEVIEGKWGNGEDRKNRLTQAGYDYATIQRIVNQLCKN